MKKNSVKKEIKTDVPDIEPFEGRDSLRQKEDLIQMQNTVAEELRGTLKTEPKQIANLFSGLLEIADFMLKNTTGVGSNFQLAECDVSKISRDDVMDYYKHIFILLGYHFGRLVPQYQESVWKKVIALTQDPELCVGFSRELETCLDHENGDFSPVQAGHKLWERAQKTLHVVETIKNNTARIYYQTAPGQNLIYIVERGSEEGWLDTD
jgi:hypothetical protein